LTQLRCVNEQSSTFFLTWALDGGDWSYAPAV